MELFEGAFWNDPYPAYAALRDDRPVCRVRTDGGLVWVLSATPTSALRSPTPG